MGKRKIKLELISNVSVRKTTLKKRKAGLLKKLNELTTLCAVTACAIIFTSDAKPDVWPSPSEAINVLDMLNNLPEEKQGKYMMDQDIFLTRSILLFNEKLEKLRKKNQELEIELVMDENIAGENIYDSDQLEHMKGLVHVLRDKIEFVTNKIESEGLKP